MGGVILPVFYSKYLFASFDEYIAEAKNTAPIVPATACKQLPKILAAAPTPYPSTTASKKKYPSTIILSPTIADIPRGRRSSPSLLNSGFINLYTQNAANATSAFIIRVAGA